MENIIKRIFSVAYPTLVAAILCTPSFAATVFVSQSGGSVSCGADGTQTSTAIGSLTSGSWAAGNTLKLCGTLTSALTAQGSGSSGSPVTVFFEAGANITMSVLPTLGGINLNGHSWIVINGGTPCGPGVSSCNGKVADTANGTSLANQNINALGVNISAASNIEIKNLEIGPVYVHVTGSGTSGPGWEVTTQPNPACIWEENEGSSNVHIHDNKIHDCNWAVDAIKGTSGGYTNWEIDHNDLFNIDHCFAIGIDTAASADTMLFHDNHCHDTSNWDDTTITGLDTNNHHDGVHAYQVSGSGAITNLVVYNNKFDGSWGAYTTSQIFEECTGSGHVDMTAFNNFFTTTFTGFQLTNGTVNDGNIGCSATSHTNYYNNTFICNTAQATYCNQLLTTIDYRNNVQINQNGSFGLLFSVTSGTTGTFNFNVYASATANPFYINAVQSSYSTWKASGGGRDSSSPAGNPFSSLATVGINSSGVPQAGFVGTGQGTNLTSLCTGLLTALCQDQNGVARPSSGAWDIGAYQFVAAGAVSSPATMFADFFF